MHKMVAMISKQYGMVLASALMLAAAFLGFYWKPGQVQRGSAQFQLTDVFPERFAGWRLLPSNTMVVNPQAQEMLDKLYSQLLTRTYVNAAGYVIMLSVAYGDDQRGGLQAHMPDVCYPAQGFALLGAEAGAIDLPPASLPVQKLKTALKARKEPVTYWFTFGQHVMRSPNAWQRRVVELRAAIDGKVPDGMLVRVSSIDENAADAFRQQERFIKDLVNAVPASHRARVTGNGASM
jgi:EpsI family protein